MARRRRPGPCRLRGRCASRAPAFAADIRRYWPDLGDDALLPAYSGVRPKLSGAGTAAADFHIAGPGEHGCRVSCSCSASSRRD